ncbi:MAG: hypothetical protein E7392_06140 [Ruminococcaceae bacterium]|nr:hypothetical protein [Oscillospiraceae bacterium]
MIIIKTMMQEKIEAFLYIDNWATCDSMKSKVLKYEETVPYKENNLLDTWTHNKTIQKAIESLRISKEKKEYLKTLKKSRLDLSY